MTQTEMRKMPTGRSYRLAIPFPKKYRLVVVAVFSVIVLNTIRLSLVGFSESYLDFPGEIEEKEFLESYLDFAEEEEESASLEFYLEVPREGKRETSLESYVEVTAGREEEKEFLELYLEFVEEEEKESVSLESYNVDVPEEEEEEKESLVPGEEEKELLESYLEFAEEEEKESVSLESYNLEVPEEEEEKELLESYVEVPGEEEKEFLESYLEFAEEEEKESVSLESYNVEVPEEEEEKEFISFESYLEVPGEEEEEEPFESYIEFAGEEDGGPHPLLSSKRRLINDVSLPWNETMHRPWLAALSPRSMADLGLHNTHNRQQQPQSHENHHHHKLPSTMILLTDYGWNTPNQTLGIQLARSLRERELYSAIVNHPLFHPTAWRDIHDGTLPLQDDTNYYVFLDQLTCTEANYPTYGIPKANYDYFHNRSHADFLRLRPGQRPRNGYINCHPPESFHDHYMPLFQESDHHRRRNITATLVLFNCQTNGNCKLHNFKEQGIRTSVAFIDGNLHKIDRALDQGLIPPAGAGKTVLTAEEESAIRSCSAEAHRDFPLVYMGNFRSGRNFQFQRHYGEGGARLAYLKYHNASERIIIQEGDDPKPLDHRRVSADDGNGTAAAVMSYTDVLRRAKLALAPRGDNKFSYRFTEVLSAGAIPVYHGDNYVLPFRPELFDWDRCAVLLPERDAGEVAMGLIRDMLLPDPEVLCAMRNYCYFEIYKKYVETPEKIISGIIRGLDLVNGGRREEFRGIECDAVVDPACNDMR